MFMVFHIIYIIYAFYHKERKEERERERENTFSFDLNTKILKQERFNSKYKINIIKVKY